QLLVLTGTPLDDAEAMAKEIMTLEIKIAASHLSKVDQRDPLSNYHKMSISKFQELTPHIDWNELFQIMGVQTDSINVAHPMYFKTLDS
ncbi:M13 family metallopeptidase N-terminal domain-containing protein, partial [Acinetobacter baumannii]